MADRPNSTEKASTVALPHQGSPVPNIQTHPRSIIPPATQDEPKQNMTATVNTSQSITELEKVISGSPWTWRGGFNQSLSKHEALKSQPWLAIELLYQHNLLYSRAQLFKHCVEKGSANHFTDAETVRKVRSNLNHYSEALRDYRAFRDEKGILFGDIDGLVDVGQKLANIEEMTIYAAEHTPESEERRTANDWIHGAKLDLEQLYHRQLRKATSSGLLKDSKVKAKKGLTARLAMALGGGFALIAPMLIIVLHATKVTTLVTSSCFVFAVGMGLAIAMDTAEPKDIIACTAAYAAVLVVFVGVGGGA